MQNEIEPNPGKKLIINIDGREYVRIPIKTEVIKKGDDIILIAKKYTMPIMGANDILFISEKVVAISQGRAYPINEIKPSFFANILSRFVHKSPYGIGLGSPFTMQLAIGEVGLLRILFGAAASAITKPFGLKGVFYKVVGKNINAIDGPCDYTLPPYNTYAKLGPLDPDGVANKIQVALQKEVVIIDANDLGVNVLGRSENAPSDEFCQKVFADNPLGQASEQTPLCIIRRI